MAVSISTITKSAGWARSDVILALEEAFDIVEFHGATQSGIVTFITQKNGGEDDHNNNQYWYDVEAETTSGIGTGASFDIYRSGGVVNSIMVNRPGYGYTDGEYLVLPSSGIGATVGLGITVSVAGRSSATGYGSTTTFYVKNVGVGSEYPFGVLRHEIESNKKYGTICRALQVWSDNQISFGVGPFFHPYSPKYDPIAINESNYNSDDGSSGRQYQFVGYPDYDCSQNSGLIADDNYTAWYEPNDEDGFDGDSTRGASSINQTGQCHTGNNTGDIIEFATATSPTTHDLKLRVYHSALDPKFAIFSFTQPSVAGSVISDNTFLTFFFHNYTSSLWDYDEQWNGGLTFIKPSQSTAANAGNYCHINFDTFLGGNLDHDHSYSTSLYYTQDRHGGARSALMGYASVSGTFTDSNAEIHLTTQYRATGTNYGAVQTEWSSNATTYNQTAWASSPQKIYVRRSTDLKDLGSLLPASSNYNAVIKGIPVCSSMVPCPYYLPDDFVLIDFRYASSQTDIQQGDTITISGSEVYEVITGSYNQYTETAGILLCARKV